MNAHDDICHLSISEQASAIRARELSPVDLTEAYLARIETHQSGLNAFIAVTADQARAQAREAEAEISASGPRSALHGIALAHKDIVNVANTATTCGSEVLAQNVARDNGAVIDRLHSAGAISLGKLNMNEFATILPSDHFGSTVNPWNAEHTPGGSSSGSGVAVASGLCAGALGTDTGGSIRLPATYCGITGLKATYGRISNRGVFPLAWSLDHIGPMTRSARDAALIYEAIAGYDPEDLASQDVTPSTQLNIEENSGLRGVHIAFPATFLPEMTDPDVSRAMTDALAVFRELGAKVTTVDIPALNDAWPIAERIICAEASTVHAPYLDSVPELYGAKIRKFLERARTISAQDYVKARGDKARFKRTVLSALSAYDALVLPGALTPPPPLGARTLSLHGIDQDVLMASVAATCPFNLTGQPALSVPSGLSAAGLPVGIQIVGKLWDEAMVLRLGQAFQSCTTWHSARPEVVHS
jgi:aspartyl-tRNA(Asn)/glutamyl-tRNA(Gln) amidotransferase subunit A